MSIESARAFYDKVATDEAFRKQLRNAASDDERRATIRAAGYNFTPEEWGAVTDQLRELNSRELSEAELESVAGGVVSLGGSFIAIYGAVFPPELSWPC